MIQVGIGGVHSWLQHTSYNAYSWEVK